MAWSAQRLEVRACVGATVRLGPHVIHVPGHGDATEGMACTAQRLVTQHHGA